MKYLLIDFGASFLKVVEYDSDTELYSNNYSVPSPFKHSNTITKDELRNLLQSVVSKHTHIERIVICSILGGFYNGDTYHSWKSKESGVATSCMISGLFHGEKTFHVHEHQAKSLNIKDYETGLKLLGHFDGKEIYSILGDTDCVINSVRLTENDVLINMGTGSQVATKNSRKSFIPSGRALNVFYNFFSDLGIDMFEVMSELSLDDLNSATLTVDLNVFPQSHKYNNGGSINGINETGFTSKNLISSILKSYVDQYHEFVSDSKYSRIILTGGIPKKIPVIHEYLSLKYEDKKVIVDKSEIENTHRGIVNFIEEYL